MSATPTGAGLGAAIDVWPIVSLGARPLLSTV